MVLATGPEMASMHEEGTESRVDGKLVALMEDARAYVETKKSEVDPYSTAEYMLKLIEKAVETRGRGNYGISAALVVRSNGTEFIFYGVNGMFNPGNPHQHAEMDAIQTAYKLFEHHKTNPTDTSLLQAALNAGKVEVRKAPHNHAEEILYTTLEPCPMCTVGSTINPGLKKVIVAQEDTYAGGLVEPRLSNLAPIWKKLADEHGLVVQVCQTENPSDRETYLDKDLIDLSMRIFFENREAIDLALAQGEFFSVGSLGTAMIELMARLE